MCIFANENLESILNYCAMKVLRFSILFIVLLMPPGAALGQSQTSEVTGHRSDTTIVRYWKEAASVVYTHNSYDENWFLLVDSAVLHVQKMAVPPYVTVNDFRILHDTVFVGGHYVLGGTPMGLLACFAINDFYTGAGTYHWDAASSAPMVGGPMDGCQSYLCDIARLAVYDSSGCSKIAFIAKNYFLGETSMRVGIGRARFDGTMWDWIFMFNKYAIEEYTDIVTTQNYVVAVARTNDSARLALRVFPKGGYLYPAGTWPTDNSYPNKYGQGFSDLEVDEDVMATALDGDGFAVAYHYKNSPDEGLALKTFGIAGGAAVLQEGLTVPCGRQPGSRWKMRDVRYSPSKQSIIVLNDFDGGTVGGQASIVYRFPLPSLSAGVVLYNGSYLLGHGLHALDPFGGASEAFVASGNYMGGGYLTLMWEAVFPPASCGLPDIINGIIRHVPPYIRYMETNLIKPPFRQDDMPSAVEEQERTTLCNQ